MTSPDDRGESEPPAPEQPPPAGRLWLTTRVTGLLLALVLPLHVLAVVVLPDLSELTAYRVDGRWESVWLRALDWLVPVLAVVHGALALQPRVAAIRSSWLRQGSEVVVVAAAVLAVLLVTSVAGTYEWP
ncbi:MAG: hypothetical protein MUF83_04140 [Acidimicrobiales bacterium]|nr:hypothetical protein [Acidimicrobiales bacterium]